MADDSSRRASLWLMMYCSSGAGNAGDRGTAMDLAARMANRVTLGADGQSRGAWRDRGGSGRLTHIIVAVLDQERDALAVQVVSPRSLVQAVPDLANVAQQLPVPEPTSAVRVDDGGRVRVMAGNRLEHGQLRERRRHSHAGTPGVRRRMRMTGGKQSSR